MEILEQEYVLSKILAIFFSLTILCNAIFCKKMLGSFLHPASMFSLAWFFFTFIPIIVVIEVPVNPIPIFFIFIVCISFSSTAFIFNWRKKKLYKNNYITRLNIIFFSKTQFVLSLLSIFFSSLIIINSGFSFQMLTSDLINTSASFASKRVSEEVNYGIVGTISIFLTYLTALLGGVIIYTIKSKKRKIWLLTVSFFPAIFVMLTQSSKLVFLVSIIVYVSGIFLMKVYEDNDLKINFKSFFRFALVIILISPIVFIAFISREGYNNFSNLDEGYDLLKPAINSYVFGSLFAFCDFFTYYCNEASICVYKIEKYTMGYYSFKPLFEMFGGNKYFPPGYYDDNFSYKKLISTNLYTAFRGFIQDFGILGTIIFFIIFGGMVNSCYYFLKFSKRKELFSAVYIVFLAFLGVSFLLNIFTARYILLVGTGFYLVLIIGRLLKQKIL